VASPADRAYDEAIEMAAECFLASRTPEDPEARDWIEEAVRLRDGFVDENFATAAVVKQVLMDVIERLMAILAAEVMPKFREAMPDQADAVEARIDESMRDVVAGIEVLLPTKN
jgi:hypothetical protein